MITTGASVSLDGYIAGPGGTTGFELLFEWYGNGDVVRETTHPELTFRTTEVSARQIAATAERTGVVVVGRRLFDITNGWDGIHPFDIPIVVLTHNVPEDWKRKHPDAPFTFAGSLDEALAAAREIAGAKDIGVNGGEIATQCLEAGVL